MKKLSPQAKSAARWCATVITAIAGSYGVSVGTGRQAEAATPATAPALPAISAPALTTADLDRLREHIDGRFVALSDKMHEVGERVARLEERTARK